MAIPASIDAVRHIGKRNVLRIRRLGNGERSTDIHTFCLSKLGESSMIALRGFVSSKDGCNCQLQNGNNGATSLD